MTAPSRPSSAAPSTPSSSTGSRYSWGADEHLVVQLAEAMSLEANVTAMAMAERLGGRRPDGVSDICPANASLLVRFDPDVIAPEALEAVVRDVEHEVADLASPSLHTRIVEIPVWYDDPFTRGTGARFRDRHQRPEGTDLEYAVAELGLGSVQEFVDRHSGSAWITSMVGFVAGLPFLFQLVPRDRQLELPKYLRPRTDTPPLTVGHGGCFACVYSVRGAGGYQMFGITPVPIFDPGQTMPDFGEFSVFFRPGDIVRFRPVDGDEYDDIRQQVAGGDYRIRHHPVEFRRNDFLADPQTYNARLLAVLDGD